MSKTTDNLNEAFAGESQANRKYLAYAKKADQEGHPQVAKLFRAAAAAETVHAHTHLKALEGVQSTTENLQDAAKGENYEAVSMYPQFIADAQAEGASRTILNAFIWAMEAEKVHENLYRKALDTLGQPGEGFDYFVCPVCGYTAEGEAPEKCPVCGTPGSRFERIT